MKYDKPFRLLRDAHHLMFGPWRQAFRVFVWFAFLFLEILIKWSCSNVKCQLAVTRWCRSRLISLKKYTVQIFRSVNSVLIIDNS